MTQGVEDNCNPPGRGLGPQPTTDTGVANVDAYLWTHIPGNSGGSCNGGPPPGTFFPAYAIGLASRANGKARPRHAQQAVLTRSPFPRLPRHVRGSLSVRDRSDG